MNRTRLTSALIALGTLLLTSWLLRLYWPVPANKVAITDNSLPEAPPVVRLSEEKLLVAGIKTQLVVRSDLPLLRSLPARFAYDETRHIAVRAATDGVIEDILVKPGDDVKIGQTIAVLRSPTVGAARSEVLTRIAEYDLAKSVRDRQLRIYQGVENLTDSISRNEPIEGIKEEFKEATLGIYGGELITKYSRAILAKRLVESAGSIRDSGAISGKIQLERQSELQQTRAELEAAVDQSLFDTRQAYQQAEADQQTAERSLAVARQRLLTLLGTNQRFELDLVANSQKTDFARLEITSPISGTVESKAFSTSERVTTGAELFIIADTSQLWLKADVRNRDWSALQVQEGDQVVVTTPAIDGDRSEATVYFVGREVDAATGTIPVVATLYNISGKYRPGLFARVEIPIGNLPNVLVIPDSAIVDIGGEPNVFLEQNQLYQPVMVETGARSGNLVEIRSGLVEGQRIVVAGAFLLKSELLLVGEE